MYGCCGATDVSQLNYGWRNTRAADPDGSAVLAGWRELCELSIVGVHCGTGSSCDHPTVNVGPPAINQSVLCSVAHCYINGSGAGARCWLKAIGPAVAGWRGVVTCSQHEHLPQYPSVYLAPFHYFLSTIQRTWFQLKLPSYWCTGCPLQLNCGFDLWSQAVHFIGTALLQENYKHLQNPGCSRKVSVCIAFTFNCHWSKASLGVTYIHS